MSPSKKPIQVTDHAVLRYMERVMGLNVEIVREHIVELCAGAAAFGAVCVRAEGHRFEIDRARVCTVTPDHLLPSRTGRQLSERRARA